MDENDTTHPISLILNGHNYSQCDYAMNNFFEGRHSLRYITGDVPKPVKLDSNLIFSFLSMVALCKILTQGRPLEKVVKWDVCSSLFELSSLDLPPHRLFAAATPPLASESLHPWHSRLGHASLSCLWPFRVSQARVFSLYFMST